VGGIYAETIAIKQQALVEAGSLRLAVAEPAWNDAAMDEARSPDPLPTTVLTGFLGSGKTTLLRRALADPGFTDTAVIVNEMGVIAIDHYLVDFVEGGVLELPGGCLCCAVREDLARTLRDLIDRRDAGEVRPFRRVVIETSGLADPAPILYTLGADPVLDACLKLGRVVTVVDAETGAATIARFAEATRQVAMADALVISKTDLAPVSGELDRALAALNPQAERIVGREASDPGQVLFGSHANFTASVRELAQEPEAIHSHNIETFSVVLEGDITRLDFAKALGALAGAWGSDLLRVKGIVAFADCGGRVALVQAAQHTLFAPEWLDDWPDADRRSRLVFIVHNIPREEILAHFAFASPRVLGLPAPHPHVHA
jgi:G3E family GTPase